MNQLQVKTHSDGIWISNTLETKIVKTLQAHICQAGWVPLAVDSNLNFSLPWQYQRGNLNLHCRVVDSVYHPSTAPMSDPDTIFVTDSHALQTVVGSVISVLPEFWHIWHFEPAYTDRPATYAYNCFMNRPRPERNFVFYELVRRQIITQGFVSYNCNFQDLELEFFRADLHQYRPQHEEAKNMLPYNTVNAHGTLEQCIIDSRVSLVIETYTSDSDIVFSEKLFRTLQLPRPWLLYCSPGSVEFLRSHGFDVLDDYVDHGYDDIVSHHARLTNVLDQLETFVGCTYSQQDYDRFRQASRHNQKLLQQFQQDWPAKFEKILSDIKLL